MKTKAQISHDVRCKLNRVFLLSKGLEQHWDGISIIKSLETRTITVRVITTLVCQMVDHEVVYWINGSWFYQVDDLINHLEQQQEIEETNQIWQA